MRVNHRTAADFRVQPWRNGGGRTTELAVEPGDGNKFVWRLSIAEVERSGPFSDFAGYHRTIMLLEGDGMALAFDGHEPQCIVEPHRPFVFDGGWKTDCRLLGGPVRDLNLMVDHSRARGAMQVRAVDGPIELLAAARRELILGLQGAVEMDAEGKTYRLRPGELLRLDDAQGITLALRPLEPGSCVAHIAIDLKGAPA
jgi:uncharacterized protein